MKLGIFVIESFAIIDVFFAFERIGLRTLVSRKMIVSCTGLLHSSGSAFTLVMGLLNV